MKKNVAFLGATVLIILSFFLGQFMGKGCSSPQATSVLPTEMKQSSLSQKTREASATADDTLTLSPQALQTTKLELLTLQPQTESNTLVTTGDIQPDDNRVFHINSFVGGRIRQESVLLGDFITAGQTIAVIQNLEVARIQATYIHELHLNEIEIAQAKTRLALANLTLARERRLLAEGISPRKDYYQAETDARIAATTLAGAREHATHIRSEAQALLSVYGTGLNTARSETIQTEALIKAPRSGVIIKKNITVGDMVTPDIILYEVADLSTVWLNMAIYPKDYTTIHLGQVVTFTSDTLPNIPFTGTVDYLPPATSTAQSPTFTARAFLKNPKGLLKTGMFGAVKIQLNIAHPQQAKPFVPERAVQKTGTEAFVFKQIAPNQYQRTVIILGEKVADGYLVEQGVAAGETLVGQGSFILKAEWLKNNAAPSQL
jgi:membrane fusion protein, heavy metal efflux system